MWAWEPPKDVARELNAQLDAIWSATTGRAPLVRELASNGIVEIAIVLEHHGSELLLGWTLDRRHTSSAPLNSERTLTSTNTTTPSQLSLRREPATGPNIRRSIHDRTVWHPSRRGDRRLSYPG